MKPSVYDIHKHFWELCRSKQISPVQGFLYLFLVEECNRQFWENDFEISNTLICATLSITENTMDGARKKLKELGLIDFVPGVRKKSSPIYRILYLNNSGINRGETADKLGDKPGPIIRKDKDQKKDKDKNTNTSPDGSTDKSVSASNYFSFLEIHGNNIDACKTYLLEIKPQFIEPYVDYWNFVAATYQVPRVDTIHKDRKKHFRTRLKEPAFEWVKILDSALQSDWLVTKSNCFNFDWLIKNQSNYTKVLEGAYKNGSQGSNKSNQPVTDKYGDSVQKARADYEKRRQEREKSEDKSIAFQVIGNSSSWDTLLPAQRERCLLMGHKTGDRVPDETVAAYDRHVLLKKDFGSVSDYESAIRRAYCQNSPYLTDEQTEYAEKFRQAIG